MPQFMRQILYFNLDISEEVYLFTKRMLDIIFSTILLVMCVFLCPLVYFCVKYKSPGSFIYTQKRNGLNGKHFTIYKLRTMYSNRCDDGRKQATHKDPRVTIGGKLLRCLYIDELPQLYNVLIGDMSLVGPRPHAIPMDEDYSAKISYYKERYKVKPGITGLAQVSGSHGETKNLDEMKERVLFDIEYLRKKSLWLDFIILLKTLKIVFNKLC